MVLLQPDALCFPLQYYWLFVLSRGLVGIGESSYSSISPTIIGDLFTNNSRTTMLSVFYLAIPLGRWDSLVIIPHMEIRVQASGVQAPSVGRGEDVGGRC